jgi:hypothetical protein
MQPIDRTQDEGGNITQQSRSQTGEEWKTGNRKQETENRQIDQDPISGFLSPVFDFFSVRLPPSGRAAIDSLA